MPRVSQLISPRYLNRRSTTGSLRKVVVRHIYIRDSGYLDNVRIQLGDHKLIENTRHSIDPPSLPARNGLYPTILPFDNSQPTP